jgi:hypothetical protein
MWNCFRGSAGDGGEADQGVELNRVQVRAGLLRAGFRNGFKVLPFNVYNA